MEYGIYLFMCGWHLGVFFLGYFAHVAIYRKVWNVRGVEFKYAGEQSQQAGGRFEAHNPHHEVR